MRYKLVLKDMAMKLSKAKQILEDNSDAFAEHSAKILIYNNSTNDFNGWIRTLAIICSNVGGLEVKTKSGKLSEKEYKELLFDSINSYKDIRQIYYRLLLKDFPECEKGEDTNYLNNCYKLYKELESLLISKFIDKEDYSLSQYKNLLTEFFNSHLN